MSKSLLFPYIKELDSLSLDAVTQIIDESGVRCSIDSLNWADRYPYHPLTVVHAAHSGNALYFDFVVRCNYLSAVHHTNNSPVWDDSSVSVFIQPKQDGEYYNFDFNCIGAINAAHRLTRRPVSRLTDDEINMISVLPSCGSRPFREVEGLFTWTLLVRIPLSLLGIKYDGVPLKMRGNFCKCASGTSQPHFLSWSPINTPDPEFHSPEAFGDFILA